MRRDPVYAPPTSLLGRLGADEAGACPPPRQRVLVAARVDHPPHDGVDPLVGVRPLRPARTAANLLHQVLACLWSLGDVPSVEVPESGAQSKADGDSCGAERRPPRSTAPLESQVPPPEEVVEVAEAPHAEARTPQTCDRPCGPVGPGARQLAAKAGKILQLEPRCAGKHTFEGQYTPFTVDSPSERGKPSPPVEYESPCPCECVCTPIPCMVDGFGLSLGGIDPAFAWLGCFLGGLMADVLFPDSSVGCGYARDQAGTVARSQGGTNPALDALRGGQSPGLGILAGRELDLGLMRPALSLAALSTSGIPGPAALAAPEIPGEGALRIFALRGEELPR
jgi:hypothetical protein